MANDTNKIVKTFLEAMNDSEKKRTSAYDTPAMVTRIEGQTAWVHIAGGVDETPVQMTMNARSGDTVLVRVSGGRAWLTGNATSPPTDDSRAIVAEGTARTATTIAKTSKVAVEELATTLVTEYTKTTTLVATYATIANLTATNGNVTNLTSRVANIESAYITTAQVNTLLADYTKTSTLEANYATITDLHTNYATISLSNVTTENVKNLLVSNGIIKSATIVDGHITGTLDAITVNGVNIIAGTVVADRLVIRGTTQSIVYALNNYGQISSQQVNTIDGYILTERTVNANRIVANSITAGEIAANTITANEIAANTITGAQIVGTTLSGIFADIGTVTAGILTSSDWDYDYDTPGTIYPRAGMRISLTDKYIRTPNFAVINGNLYARNGTFSGSVAASSGTIGGYNISSTANTGTTANGGHVYTNSLYAHSSDSTYEYESGLYGGGAYNNAAFYIKRMASGGSWSSSDHVFYVRNDGYMMATTGKIGPWNFNGTSIYKGGGYQSATAGSAYFGDSGLSVTDKFYVTSTGNAYFKGSILHVENSSSSVHDGRIVFASGYVGSAGAGMLNVSATDYLGLVGDIVSITTGIDGETGLPVGRVNIETANFSITGSTSILGNLTVSVNTATSRAVGVSNSVGKVMLYMSNAGNMGVYDATNSKYLIYKNSSNQTFMSFVASDEASTSAANMFIGSTGRVQKSNGSSKRYKKEIKPLSDWKSVLDIPVVSFKYRDNYLSKEDQRYGVTVPGFIAEEVDEHYSVAADRVDGKVHDWNARYIIPPMLAVEQDHEKRIRELEDEIRRLKGEVA